MKSASAAAVQTIQKSTAVRGTAELIAEWEHNRFSPITSTTVTPTQAQDGEWLSIYDLDSITLPNRPGAGAAKARFDASGNLKMSGLFVDEKLGPRYYLSTDFDQYKYWSSTQKSSATMVGGSYAFSTPVELTVLYTSPVRANKIVAGFETSYSRPVSYTVKITVDGTNWTTVGTNVTLDSEGKISLWRGSGTWSTTANYANETMLRGVRITVSSLNVGQSHLDVIQLGLRLEKDLTEYLESYSKTFEISDRSFVVPIGKASSNTGSIELDNVDRLFNDENASSPYFGLIGKKARFVVNTVLNTTAYGGSATERIRELTMWADSWNGQDDASVSVELKDSSVFLQEIMVPRVLWENITFGAAAWQMLDILGFSNFNYERADIDTKQAINYFWPDEDRTVWEQFVELAEGTQTAMYYDEYDVFQVKTRSNMFDASRSIDWELDAEDAGDKLADIVELTSNRELMVNKAEINYRPAKYSEFNNGLPKMEVAWEPEEETVVLRATQLAKNLTTSGTELWINGNDAAYWPYEGLVNIRGEVIRYSGKEYSWYHPNGTTIHTVIDSIEDKERYDKLSHSTRKSLNHFTGKFIIKQRGVYGTGTASHLVAPYTTYSGTVTDLKTTLRYPWSGGITQKNGYLEIGYHTTMQDVHVYHLVRHETAVLGDNVYFGTRLRFGATPHQVAGIWFDGNAVDAGYYLEVATTQHVDANESRAIKHELSLTVLNSNTGTKSYVKSDVGDQKGYRASIVANKWYDIDVVLTKTGSTKEIVTVYVDGVEMGQWDVPSANRPLNEAGRFGLFTRWKTTADFEYLYAVSDPGETRPDKSTFLDLREGGFTSGYIQRQWRYNTRVVSAYFKGRTYPQIVSRSNYAFDEFAPIVHEVREFDIKFSDQVIPVQHSNLYLSNTRQVAVMDYYSDPFGAKFVLANSSRENAVLQGEDTLTFGAENSVTQKMFVYGRALYQEDDLSVTKEDTASIRKNGTVDLVFDNRFIQTEKAAVTLGEWIVRQWAKPSDELIVKIFANPLIQLGDLVSVNYPRFDMSHGSHKYFVVAMNGSFSSGMETDLVLRRAYS